MKTVIFDVLEVFLEVMVDVILGCFRVFRVFWWLYGPYKGVI